MIWPFKKKTSSAASREEKPLADPKMERWRSLGIRRVSFKAGAPDRCNLAASCDGDVYPISEAPPIPLSGCDSKRCWCMLGPHIEGVDD